MAWKTTDSSLLKSLMCTCERKILASSWFYCKSETYKQEREGREEHENEDKHAKKEAG
jgi:hypothetical protein